MLSFSSSALLITLSTIIALNTVYIHIKETTNSITNKTDILDSEMNENALYGYIRYSFNIIFAVGLSGLWTLTKVMKIGVL